MKRTPKTRQLKSTPKRRTPPAVPPPKMARAGMHNRLDGPQTLGALDQQHRTGPVVVKTITRHFAFERETTNKVRFNEVVPEGETEVIGALYVDRATLVGHRAVMLTLHVIE